MTKLEKQAHQALQRLRGKWTLVAKKAGVSKHTIYKMLHEKKYQNKESTLRKVINACKSVEKFIK